LRIAWEILRARPEFGRARPPIRRAADLRRVPPPR
jgi:hypothetical protein